MNIIVVDDQVLFRESLVNMLQSQADMAVVGEAGSVREAVEKSLECEPDLVLMDMMLPDGDGLQAMRKILSHRPETKVVILTVHNSEDMMVAAFLFGAVGYLLKNMPISKLLVSLRAVERGEVALSRKMVRRLIQEFTRMLTITNQLQTSTEGLTTREIEVLRQLGTGATNRKIAEHLFITENTVKIHVHNIYEKLKIKNRHEAVNFARQIGLMDSKQLVSNATNHRGAAF